MTSHFTPKSLAFYGGAIASVTILFSIVSAYGEANLKAPRRIDGSYHIAAEELPNCLNSQSLMLVLQQSGIYLSGSLLTRNAAAQVLRAAEKRPLLNGHWRNDQLTLEGMVDLSPDCRDRVTIQATTTALPKTTDNIGFDGTLQFGVGAAPTRFTASKQSVSGDNPDEAAQQK